MRHVLKQLEGRNTKLSYRSCTPARWSKCLDMGITVLMESAK